jgi:hypothetical protein
LVDVGFVTVTAWEWAGGRRRRRRRRRRSLFTT